MKKKILLIGLALVFSTVLYVVLLASVREDIAAGLFDF